jgi:hypothetical protein
MEEERFGMAPGCGGEGGGVASVVLNMAREILAA